MATFREIVRAQVDHMETGVVPYTIEFEPPAEKRLTDYFGNEDWKKQILPYVDQIGGTFDSWDTMVEIDPNDPTKKIDAYGSLWTKTTKIAHLDKPVLSDIPLYQYKFPTLDAFLKPEKLQRMQKEATENPDRYKVALIGATYFELSWRLLGVEETLIMCIEEPDEYEEIMNQLDILLNQFVDECVKLPVDAIMFFDDWCDQRSCLMGPARWRKFIKPRLARLYDKVHKSGKKVINHICGNVTPLIPELIEIGLDVLESVQPEAVNMNPYGLKQQYGKDLAFWGGLGCQSIVTFGTPVGLQSEIRKLRSEMSVGGGYILAPAKTINETVPMDNLLAIYNTFIEENHKC